MKQSVLLILFMVLWSVLHGLVLNSFGMMDSEAVLDSVISNAGLLLVLFIIGYPIKFYLPTGKVIWQWIIFGFLLSIAWVFITSLLLESFLIKDSNFEYYSSSAWFVRWSVAILIMGFSLVIRAMSVLLKRQDEIQFRQKQALELSKQTELKKLREQLHPHFLFNTLNSVSALINLKPEKAKEMVLQLSEFLRFSVATQENRQHSLAEELRQINLYLEIEKVRFGHRLQTEINCLDQHQGIKVPALILQPLVENAVKYGLYDTTEAVLISISCSRNDEYLMVKVTNPYDSETFEGVSGTGFGHKSIKKNLYLLYGRADLFRAKSKDGNYEVELKIPLT